MKRSTAREDLARGVWEQNPVFAQFLGLCPTLAVTNTLANGIAMALATAFVLIASSLLVSSLKQFIPNEVRISAYILIIATFVREFSSVAIPLKGVKAGAGKGAANEVDLITGATISSRTVVAIVNRSIENMKPLLQAHGKGAVR